MGPHDAARAKIQSRADRRAMDAGDDRRIQSLGRLERLQNAATAEVGRQADPSTVGTTSVNAPKLNLFRSTRELERAALRWERPAYNASGLPQVPLKVISSNGFRVL